MIAAAGGESNLLRHQSVEIHAVKSYENQGVAADLTVLAQAPARRTEKEIWSAAGRQIGQLRIYFDGTQGGQETTFGQDSIFDKRENDEARRENDFRPLLNLKRLYSDMRLLGSANIAGQDTWVLHCSSGDKPVRLFVSQRTALLVQREKEGQSRTFSDYRLVDGVQIPFVTTVHDALGETSIRITRIEFNRKFPDDLFASHQPK
jgi:hypothetical protein